MQSQLGIAVIQKLSSSVPTLAKTNLLISYQEVCSNETYFAMIFTPEYLEHEVFMKRTK